MDELLLSIVVMSGLCAISSSAERRYHFVYDPKNMTEAQRHCREKYTDLATIRDLEDVRTLNTMVDSSKLVDNRAWIGLYHDVDSLRWSLPNTSFYKPMETEFRPWMFGPPQDFDIEERCTMMNADGTWMDTLCYIPIMAVCFDVKGLNETFVLIDNTMTWTQAQSYCREHHTDLAIVRNLAENQMVQNVLTLGGAWIGFFRDRWRWSDGSNSSFTNWNPNDPYNSSKTCVAADFSSNGQWVGLNCNVMSAFICYGDVVPVSKQVIKVRLVKRSSSLDLNDPVVMEDLLKQLKQRMKDQGLNSNIKLSWRKQADGKVFHKEEKETKKKIKDEL